MFKILTIPFNTKINSFDEEILNNFCLNKRLKSCRADFFILNGKPHWTVFLDYDPVFEDEVKNYTSDLNEKEKVLFEQLRGWRRERAEKEGVPVFIIATNRELKDIIKTSPKTLETLKSVKGFGRKKIEKYGKEITSLITAFQGSEVPLAAHHER